MSTVIFAPVDETFGNISSGTLEGLIKVHPRLKVTTYTIQTTWAKTHAMTPDKMDRLSRKTEGNILPYPLTEEEATPQVPTSDETQ
ncbi:MAG: hypothetical protein OK457_11050 [Thaumarchaeota archaeon]|nr:hypothetical protein [Nitrososphaerota archaeon]